MTERTATKEMAERIAARIDALAAISKSPDGITRLVFTPEHARAGMTVTMEYPLHLKRGPQIASEAPLHLFVRASGFSEKRGAFFGPML